MLSKYLQVPLRYHIVHFSSRSFVKDKVQGIGGEYPLYRRGVERERFEKAVLYLNRNVQQVSGCFQRRTDPKLSTVAGVCSRTQRNRRTSSDSR